MAAPDGHLKYYKRQKYVWTQIFEMPINQNFISLRGYLDNEAVVGTTKDGGLFKLILSNEGEKLNATKMCQFSPFYTNFAIIYPRGDVLVAVDTFDNITCLDIKSGANISKVLKDEKNMKDVVIEANPCYPFVAIGNSCGNVFCVQLIDPRNPTLLTEFLLSREAIQHLRFSNFGHYLLAIDVEWNHFVISTMPGSKQTVLHHFRREFLMKEFFTIESRNELSIVFLVKSATSNNDSVLKINVKFDDLDAEMETDEWELATPYEMMLSFNNSSDLFYGVREKCRFIEVIYKCLSYKNNCMSLSLCRS